MGVQSLAETNKFLYLLKSTDISEFFNLSEDKERIDAGLIIRCRFCGVQATGPEAASAGRYCSLGCFAADYFRIFIISAAISLSLGVVLIFNANLLGLFSLLVGILLWIAGITFAFLTVIGSGYRKYRDHYRDQEDAMS